MVTHGEAPDATTDGDLVQRIRRGDAGAFDVLFQRHYPRVFHFALRLDGNRHNAEDIAQTAFVRAYESLERLRDGQAFLEWVYRIALNLVRDRARQRGRKPWMFLADLRKPAPVGETAEPVELADEAADPARLVTREARDRSLLEAVANLPLEFREVVVMHHFQEMDLKAMARLLGVPEGTVKSRLGRARQRLRIALADWMDGGEVTK